MIIVFFNLSLMLQIRQILQGRQIFKPYRFEHIALTPSKKQTAITRNYNNYFGPSYFSLPKRFAL